MKTIAVGPVSLTKTAFGTLLKNPVLLYPFFLLAVIDIFVLELIYFVPRFPLSLIFEPVISKTVGAVYLHYPYNYVLLAKWFHAVEIPVAIFVSCFFYGMTIEMVSLINRGHDIELKDVFKHVSSCYVNLAAATLAGLSVVQGLLFCHHLVIKRAFMIRSTAGGFFWIKKAVILSAPYVQLLIPSVVAALLAFVFAIIVLEKKNVIQALWLNFTQYGRLLVTMFGVILISDIMYLPLIFARLTQVNVWMEKVPEMSGVWLMVSIAVTLLAGALQCTAGALCYLFKNEARS